MDGYLNVDNLKPGKSYIFESPARPAGRRGTLVRKIFENPIWNLIFNNVEGENPQTEVTVACEECRVRMNVVGGKRRRSSRRSSRYLR